MLVHLIRQGVQQYKQKVCGLNDLLTIIIRGLRIAFSTNAEPADVSLDHFKMQFTNKLSAKGCRMFVGYIN